MVTCKHCSTPNSLDSTFCKRCGTAMPAEDVALAQEKLTQLITDGNTAFNEGRTDEAMAIAESACASNPSSTAALSLKVLCHERRGELAEALECADLIVDLNPDSELDKIKRNQLRTKLSVSVQLATQPPDRRTAIIGAVSAVVFFACIGVGIAKLNMRNASTKQDGLVVQNSSAGNPPVNPAQTSQGTNSQQSSQPTNQQNVQQSSTPQNSQTNNALEGSLLMPGRGPEILPGQGRIGSEDVVLGSDQVITPPNPPRGNIGSPVAPSVQNTVKLPSVGKSSENTGGGDDPSPKAEDPKSSQQNTDPGVVEINISNGSSRKSNSGGGESLGAGGAAALDRIGIQRYQLGSYGAAAASFEQALRAGGDPISLNQWLGRSYGQLGKKSEQIDAYKRCATACQNAISNGTGNKDRIKAILDTCQQQLKVLQGN